MKQKTKGADKDNGGRVSYLTPAMYPKGEFSKTDREAWDLMSALLKTMNDISEKHGAKFILFSEDGEEGKRAYFRKAGNVETLHGVDYISYEGKLHEFDWIRGFNELKRIAGEHNFQVVPFKRIYYRWNFDNHASIEGNENMALDIADFLESWGYFKDKVSQVIKKTSTSADPQSAQRMPENL